jgi:hypothetical protein
MKALDTQCFRNQPVLQVDHVAIAVSRRSACSTVHGRHYRQTFLSIAHDDRLSAG